MLRSSPRVLLSGLLLWAALGVGCGQPNQNPKGLRGPGAAVSEAASGQRVPLYSEAEDPEGDPITYTWTQTDPTTPAGTFSDDHAASPTWTAPVVDADKTFTLQLRVEDDHGNAIEGFVHVLVRKDTSP